MSRIKFERARSLIELVCNRPVSDWPDSLNANALGILQEHPKQVIRRDKDEPSCFAMFRAYSETNKVQSAIQNAIDSGELANEPTPDQFKEWLLAQGETPSEHIQAWFDARCTQQATEYTPEVEANIPTWKPYPKKTYRGYSRELYKFLEDASHKGEPCPTAKDLINAWMTKKPYGIISVDHNGFDYVTDSQAKKTADIECIRKAIKRLITD